MFLCGKIYLDRRVWFDTNLFFVAIFKSKRSNCQNLAVFAISLNSEDITKWQITEIVHCPTWCCPTNVSTFDHVSNINTKSHGDYNYRDFKGISMWQWTISVLCPFRIFSELTEVSNEIWTRIRGHRYGYTWLEKNIRNKALGVFTIRWNRFTPFAIFLAFSLFFFDNLARIFDLWYLKEFIRKNSFKDFCLGQNSFEVGKTD